LEGYRWLVQKFDLQAVYLARKLAESNPDGPSEFDLIEEAHDLESRHREDLAGYLSYTIALLMTAREEALELEVRL